MKTERGLRNNQEVAKSRRRDTQSERQAAAAREGREGERAGEEGRVGGKGGRERRRRFTFFFPLLFGARLVVICNFAEGRRVETTD